MTTKALTQSSLVVDLRGEMLHSAGLSVADATQFEIVATAGQTKWVNLQQFLEPAWSGKTFVGVLIARKSIPDAKKTNPDGTPQRRYYYLLQLVSPCPVSYSDENGDGVDEVAQPGEIVALGERSKLEILGDLIAQGGVQMVMIRPNAPIAIGHSQTMWTFDIGRRVLAQRMASAPAVTDEPSF
jgi:hypothetical protein